MAGLSYTVVKNNKGLTLIEIMIVLAIIAGLVGVMAPRFIRPSADAKREVRRFAALSKELRNQARVRQRTYRIVLSMPENEVHSYWVESAPGSELISYEEEDEKPANEDEEAPPTFQIDQKFFAEPKPLPNGLYFDRIEFGRMKEPMKTGTAYVHFLKDGLVEEVAIHITDGKTLHWTIAFHPLTGRSQIVGKDVKLDDLRQ